MQWSKLSTWTRGMDCLLRAVCFTIKCINLPKLGALWGILGLPQQQELTFGMWWLKFLSVWSPLDHHSSTCCAPYLMTNPSWVKGRNTNKLCPYVTFRKKQQQDGRAGVALENKETFWLYNMLQGTIFIVTRLKKDCCGFVLARVHFKVNLQIV